MVENKGDKRLEGIVDFVKIMKTANIVESLDVYAAFGKRSTRRGTHLGLVADEWRRRERPVMSDPTATIEVAHFPCSEEFPRNP